jgi:hypothetical protein
LPAVIKVIRYHAGQDGFFANRIEEFKSISGPIMGY